MLQKLLLSLSLLSLASACANVQAPSKASKPRWLKGNLHTHSLWSDGSDFPEMIADWYAKRDYDFLALSDHNILSDHEKWIDASLPVKRGGKDALAKYRKRFGDAWVETRQREGKTQIRLKRLDEIRPLLEKPDQFLMIQSEEISDIAFGRLYVHINATNLLERIPPQHGKGVREVISRNLRAIEAQSRRLKRPILGHLNHPNFYYSITAEDLAAVPEEH
ncbi:MAG: hypothetical protein DRI90_22535, partial [Deltaproteobacteria bacterium]